VNKEQERIDQRLLMSLTFGVISSSTIVSRGSVP